MTTVSRLIGVNESHHYPALPPPNHGVKPVKYIGPSILVHYHIMYDNSLGQSALALLLQSIHIPNTHNVHVHVHAYHPVSGTRMM